MPGIRRLAIVNRGEAAMRCLAAAAELADDSGQPISTIALYAEPDADSWFVREADEARSLGPALATEADGERRSAPADLDRLMTVLESVRADAAWVGWDFVAEPAEFAARCEKAGITFVGPPSQAIGLLADEARARQLAEQTGIPVLPLDGEPVRGAHHVEVQVMADAHRTCWAAGIRDRSIQRRSQQVIEESGSAAVDQETESRLREAAVRLCDAAGYRGAGSVGFLVDPRTRQFWFTEVSAQPQAEHPVTEMTTGTDLVKLQLQVACGGALPPAPPQVRGYAIEARISAEDHDRAFASAPRRVSVLRLPSGPGIRVDADVAVGDDIAAESAATIARIVAWGRDRTEAVSRLRRGLAHSQVVIDGGMTNQAFLISLLDRPEVRAGTFDTTWLDRLTASGTQLPAPDPVALLAAAVEVADHDRAAVLANFLASAARGRPALPDTVGHLVQLLAGGAAYRMRVYCLSRDDYRVITPGGPVEVTVRRLGRYERAMTCLGKRYRVAAVSSGPRLVIDVDGTPHVITRDDGGQVRSPAPAFVVAVLVAPGDTVRAGDPLVVLESMKMESTIMAPHAGVVRSVSAQVNTQVEAGAPLVRLRPPDLELQLAGQGGPVADFAGLACASDAADPGRRDRHRLLRAYLLGYDLEDSEAAELGRAEVASLASLPADDPGIRDEQELVEIFADIAALSAHVPDDLQDEHVRSSHEYLLSYLAVLDTERSGTPDRFARQLRRALARYGVVSLARSPELEQALLRIYRSVGRMPAAAPIVIAILGRWLQARSELAGALPGERLAILDRLISCTMGRYPGVCDLAREVRFSSVDEPLLKRTRAAAYAEIGRTLDELCGCQDPERTRELTNRVVWFPLPMRSTLRDRFRGADRTASARLLQVRTLRFYRIRTLTELRCETFAGHLSCLAEYRDTAAPAAVHLVTSYVPMEELPAFASALSAHLSTIDSDRPVVVDVESWRNAPFEAADEMARRLDGLLAHTRFGRDLHRLTITVTSATDGAEHAEEHQRTQSFTYLQSAGTFAEDTLFRNMHPMIAERMELWRLSNFELSRLASAEDVYLFRAVARSNPQDERLIALAEVRDLTPARDAAGAITGYPHMEGMLAEALAGIRRALRGRPPRQRPMNNRVVLYVRPAWDIPTSTWRVLAHRLAPLAADLGLEKVVARIQRVDAATGVLADEVLDVENIEDKAVAVRLRAPADRPIRPLTEYKQKSLQAKRRGLPYPYELVRMLTPPVDAPADFPAGDFVEYDLDDADHDHELAPVSRPYGGNLAGIVVGVITSYTALVPEGMRRVAILGDPTAGLGNLAEPECRRILGALDLASQMHVPVEWYALSSGAKIAWDSGTENMDWIAAVLRRLVEFTQSGGEVNVVVTGINVGAQPYWNAEATMLMHTRGILIMTPASAMVLTGKSSLDYSGGVSAEDNFGIGGFEGIMGPNGEAQYWAPTLASACDLLLRHYEHTYIVPGERHPRRAPTSDPADRDICASPHRPVDGSEFTAIGDIFSVELNGDRKKPFDMRSVLRAVTDSDHEPFERWAHWRDAESSIVWEAHIGGFPVCLIGLESRTVTRAGFVPADGPPSWTSGTLFPQSSRKLARAINAASGNRPVVVLANLTGFDGSPESMRKWQLEYGAEIGRAVTNFVGPILFVVVSRYHGGAFVVFSKRLHDDMETAAVSGSFASVIGGAPAAAVVLSREVVARTDKDSRVADRRMRLASATGRELADLRHELADIAAVVRAEKLKEVADEFDSIHDIERAMRVGSVDRIISPSELRQFVVGALERRLAS